jgi:cellobiose phosphorylase
MLKEIDEAEWASTELAALDETIENYAWDGNWYIRAITDDGMRIGSEESEEGKIWLNVQTWAILSGHATGERARLVAKSVQENLASEYGVAVCAPPYVKINPKIVKAPLFNEGMKENASIFSHTQGWAVIAESMLGNGDNAFNYYRSVMPAAYNDKAEIRQIEPYVNCQFTHSKFSPRFGASRLPWLTGAATWMYYSATQYILGVQPDYYGLRIDPCVPSDWKSFSVKRTFRDKVFDIDFENSEGVQKGVKRIILNNKEIGGNLIPMNEVDKKNTVRVIMGDI